MKLISWNVKGLRAAWTKGLLDFMQCWEAPLATEQQLAQAHDLAYIRQLAARAPTEGSLQVDPDTSMNRHTYTAALRALGLAQAPGFESYHRLLNRARSLGPAGRRAALGPAGGGLRARGARRARAG